MHWIVRDHRGLHVTRRPDAEIPPHVLATFRHACEAFGFLVKHGERLTALDWCERIADRYAPHHRRARVLAAITCAMLDADGGPRETVPTLDEYARAGYLGKPNAHDPGSPAWYAHAIGAHLQATHRTAPRGVEVRRGGRVLASGQLFQEVGNGPHFERVA